VTDENCKETKVLAVPSPAEVAALVDEPMCLVHRNDRGERLPFSLEGRTTTTIGRDATCDIVLADSHVSRRHATIELVFGQHLLRDEGSSNGTYLNGLRLTRSHAFGLREGDAIEIGSHRIFYARKSSVEPAVAREPNVAGYPREDLLRDGLEALELDDRARVQNGIFGLLARGPFATSVPGLLAIALDRLDGHTAAILMLDARRMLRVAGAVPAFESAKALLPLAHRVAADGRGYLARGLTELDACELGSTTVQCLSSVAAAPISEAGRVKGVLAVERLSSTRLDRSNLALLTVIADRIAEGLSLVAAKDGGDTRLGFVD
jgi:hypothetical protein